MRAMIVVWCCVVLSAPVLAQGFELESDDPLFEAVSALPETRRFGAVSADGKHLLIGGVAVLEAPAAPPEGAECSEFDLPIEEDEHGLYDACEEYLRDPAYADFYVFPTPSTTVLETNEGYLSLFMWSTTKNCMVSWSPLKDLERQNTSNSTSDVGTCEELAPEQSCRHDCSNHTRSKTIETALGRWVHSESTRTCENSITQLSLYLADAEGPDRICVYCHDSSDRNETQDLKFHPRSGNTLILWTYESFSQEGDGDGCGCNPAPRIRRQDDARVFEIAGGSYSMGLSEEELASVQKVCREAQGASCDRDQFSSELPAVDVKLDDFYIDANEVRWEQYPKCVEDGACNAIDASSCHISEPLQPHEPVRCATRDQAQNYCRWVGARLPTEAEWEWAIRSDNNRGNRSPIMVSPTLSLELSQDAPDLLPGGLGDMEGSVHEWVNGSDCRYTDWPTGASLCQIGKQGVVRGGSFQGKHNRITVRHFKLPDVAEAAIGFRCAQSQKDNLELPQLRNTDDW